MCIYYSASSTVLSKGFARIHDSANGTLVYNML